MRYKIEKMEISKSEKGEKCVIFAGTAKPDAYQYNILHVCRDDFDRLHIGDTIELLISGIAPEIAA